IILNNLYGVDIMHEAVEIAKLRLFLKLAATADVDYSRENLGLEPLPDIDFNIRAGNTLVGFASEKHLLEAVKYDKDGQYRIGYEAILNKFKEECEVVGMAFKRFKEAQLVEDAGSENFKQTKNELAARLAELNGKLNEYLAGTYGIVTSNAKVYQEWLAGHKPFHWFAEFYEIVQGNGGFDVIIGNPPYVEYKNVKSLYKVMDYYTHTCSNLFAYVLERNVKCLHSESRTGMIIPLSAFSTDRMIPLIKFSKEYSSRIHIANFSWRPGKLFEGVNLQLSILLQKIGKDKVDIKTSQYILWESEARSELFSKITYTTNHDIRLRGSIPKLGSLASASVLRKIRSQSDEIGAFFVRSSSNKIYYRRGGLYWKVFVDFITNSSEEKLINIDTGIDKYVVIASLSSNLWFWYLISTSDCRHLGNRDISSFPLSLKKMNLDYYNKLSSLGEEYVADLKKNAENTIRRYKNAFDVECLSFRVKESKKIIDQIDSILAVNYGFTEEELDFIINYDIKYRMGKELRT
ncbi:MAG: Eco57I restriction-modification methylase domain-containing protein, partial [Deltaproteobacteria bacterium]|nr:Eco57I restriction-modification methylase domain-containing protein [Deltaproteobacteria bacterium]